MLYRLCLAGVADAPHPDYLVEKLNSRQIAQWMAYDRIEPFGAQHTELCLAIVACTFAAAHSKPGHTPEVTDFMPSHRPESMDWQEMRANLQAWKDWPADAADAKPEPKTGPRRPAKLLPTMDEGS